MLPDGIETLALWHETGEWWKSESPREIHRYIDAQGIRREVVGSIPPRIVPLPPSDGPRIRKARDEKVSKAMGYSEEPKLSSTPNSIFTSRTSQRNSTGVALHALSGYSFGRSSMIAAEIPAFAADRGYGAILLADAFSLCGAVEFIEIADKVGIRGLIGSIFELPEGGELVLVAQNATGYRSLSRLITACHLGEPRRYPLCTWERLAQHTEGVICLTGGDDGPLNRHLIRRDDEAAGDLLDRLIGLYGKEHVFIEVEESYLPWQVMVNRRLIELAHRTGVTPVAGGPITHEKPDHFPAQDMLVCVETLCTIDEIEGRKPPRDPTQPIARHFPRRALNHERYLRFVDENRCLYQDHPYLIENAWRIVERCEENVLPDRTLLPKFCDDEFNAIREITYLGAHRRFTKIKRSVRNKIELELERIHRLDFTRHFLVAWDMCNWSQSEGILFSGRGSVVDSVVAYCLGLSRIDPVAFKLHFDRFLPADGQKRPDIDIDFEAARRDDVRQYLVQKYGDAHVATVGAIGTYGTRGIIREVGKVMGIPDATMGYLAKRLHGGVSPDRLEAALEARPELRDSGIPKERFHWVFKLANQLMDLPRNLRSHSSGVIISSEPIADTVPVTWSGVEGVKIIQWDKRSAKRCFDKFDVLCLRGNDVLGDTQRTVRSKDSGFDVTNLPLDDPNTYRAMRAGELIGIPQSASPAMRQAHMRIGTQDLKDAGIVQAAIRPGVGGAVKLNEFVQRRKGKSFRLCHPDLERILGPTLGIVVFQEQIDQLLQTFGGYTSDEAELIRESIYKQRREGFAEKLRESVAAQIESRGYTKAIADEVYELVAGFQGYGFAEGHALAFAEISIRSIWCQQNYPAEYFSAILNAQPAGYYGPYTLANEARIRGVRVLPPDVNLSQLTFAVEDVSSTVDPNLLVPRGGIRVPFRQIGGISEELRRRIIETRDEMMFRSFFDFVARVAPDRNELEQLILCGAFDALWPNRRSLLWAIPRAMEHGRLVRSMHDTLPLFMEDPAAPEIIDDFTEMERAIHERRILHLDIDRHLVSFERERIAAKGGITAAEASRLEEGKSVFVVGNPIRLRFPPTTSGRRVMFFDLEDETGLLNVTCFDDVYQRDGHKVICEPYVTLWGEAQHRDGHVAFMAHRIYRYSPLLANGTTEALPLPVATADFMMK